MMKLLDLFLPTGCIGCKNLGSPLCSDCQPLLALQAREVSRGQAQGFAFCDYEGISAGIINAIKESGQTSLIGPVADLMAKSWPSALYAPVLVPIPSSPANYKRRGYQHVSKLAYALERRIPGSSTRLLLRSATNRLDQSTLRPAQRLGNVSGAFQADLRGFQSEGRAIVLLDDVLTTGATIAAAKHALEQAGLGGAVFCVLAETRSKSSKAGSV